MLSEHARGSGDTTQPARGPSTAAGTSSEYAIQWVFGGGGSRVEVLRAPRLRVGRGENCHLRLDDRSMSRDHAELYRQGPVYALKDLGSRNGTWINGQRVEHSGLAAGDVLRFGDCVGVVLELEGNAPTREFGIIAPSVMGGPRLATAIANAKASARSNVPVVVVGETGTGKERIARAIHELSGRKGRFDAINCSTVPSALAEAELFGHQRGAFTGAERARAGHFQAADGGTLFLDEISELSLDIQAKLLRALEGEVVSLGGTDVTRVDVRIIAATHEPLAELVEQERFRADLAARLGGFVVVVPPLRERREEIPGLFRYFLGKHAAGAAPAVAPALVEWLCLRPWAGNVRELELLARKLLALHGDEPELRLSFAQALAGEKQTNTSDAPVAGFADRRTSDLHRLRQALERTGGKVKAAAEAIGISRRRAYRLLESETATERGTTFASNDSSEDEEA